MPDTPPNLIARLRNGDRKALEEVYLVHREEFLNYGSKFELTRDVLLDVYQDSIIALFQKLAVDQITLETASLKTYLFGIGKYKILALLKADHSKVSVYRSDEIPAWEDADSSPTVQQQQLARHFKTLGKSCQEILRLFYYRGLSIKEIVARGHYKDENTVKSQKSRCLKSLTKLMKGIEKDG